MANFYTTKKTINDIEYTAQFNGVAAALQAVDNSYIENSSNTSTEKLSKYILDNVIVEPKLSINDFGAELIGETRTKTIGGKEYTAKFNGMLAAVRAVDGSYIENSSNTSSEKFTKYILENVIVSPEKVTINDFASMNDLNDVLAFGREAMQGWGAMNNFNEVIAFGREVMQGNFRNETSESESTNKKSKK